MLSNFRNNLIASLTHSSLQLADMDADPNNAAMWMWCMSTPLEVVCTMDGEVAADQAFCWRLAVRASFSLCLYI